MKNIYIGDIHGRVEWQKIVNEHSDADNIVFIGDYLDSFDYDGLHQLDNLNSILNFKKKQELNLEKKVYLLIGNHDLHYWPGINSRGCISGFQSNMLMVFEEFFRENKKHFQIAVCLKNKLCTHAGVSSKFLKDVGYWTYPQHCDESYVAGFLNDLFFHKPNEFDFSACDSRHYGLLDLNPYGDNEEQSPVWIRPKSLQRSNKNTSLREKYIQIIGHTAQKTIDIKGNSTGGKYYYIDTLSNNEYLIEENEQFKIGKIL